MKKVLFLLLLLSFLTSCSTDQSEEDMRELLGHKDTTLTFRTTGNQVSAGADENHNLI